MTGQELYNIYLDESMGYAQRWTPKPLWSDLTWREVDKWNRIADAVTEKIAINFLESIDREISAEDRPLTAQYPPWSFQIPHND
jgi:hypothetical protein